MQGAPPGPPETTPRAPTLVVGRYAIYDEIASGGMATVHVGRLIGPAGFLRTVAVKRLHAHLAHDDVFASMFLDEALLAARIQHPNVVPTLDVVFANGELLLVMEYVRGESLSRLTNRLRELDQRLPPRIVVAIVAGALHGLHAAHEAHDEKGQPIGLVHRDMTPQNILVGIDGMARVLDFGVAKAEGRVQTTKDGNIKGKMLYMPPEQLAGQRIDRTADIYAAGVVLFEALTGVRMFAGDDDHVSITKIIKNEIKVPSDIDPALRPFDAVVRKALSFDPAKRHATAREMALAIEAVMPAASTAEVSEWVKGVASDVIAERARIVAEVERSSTRSRPPRPSLTDELAIPGLPHSHSLPALRAAGESLSTEPTRAHVLVPSVLRRRLMLAAMGLVLSLGCVGIVALVLSSRGRAEPPRAAAPASTRNDKVAVDPPMVHTAEIAPAPRAVNSPDAPEAPASSAPTPTTSSPRPKAVARPAVNCVPPYVVDKQGHRHFIPECVR